MYYYQFLIWDNDDEFVTSSNLYGSEKECRKGACEFIQDSADAYRDLKYTIDCLTLVG